MLRLHFDYGAAHSTPIKEKVSRGVVSLEEHNGLWNEVIIAQNHAEKVSRKTTSTENMELSASSFSFFFFFLRPRKKTEHLTALRRGALYGSSPLGVSFTRNESRVWSRI